jgi:hypothetical protein
MRPPNIPPGRDCCGEGEYEGDGLTRDGLAGLDGDAGAEYEREPRLPPLPARANTTAVSTASSEISARPDMSTRALGRMVTSTDILAREPQTTCF